MATSSSIRLRYTCTRVVQLPGPKATVISEATLTPNQAASENSKVFAGTPSGEIEIRGFQAGDLFRPGSEYFIDIQPAT